MIDPMEFRRQCIKSDSERDRGLVTPPDIVRADDLCYGPDPVWNRLDVYRPAAAAGPLPVIVSFHGGAWVYGSKEIYQFYCMNLAQRGFAVVNYSYRLAPEHRFPAAIADTNRVFAWVQEHAAEYGLDLSRLFAVGDSAGAMGLAVYACILTNPAYAAAYPFTPPSGLTLRGIALNCGLYTALDKQKDLAPMLPQENPAQALSLLHVISHITPAFPPSFVMTSNGDFLRDEPQHLLPVFQKHGVPHQFRCCGDDAHVLFHVFHCDIRSEAARGINDAECAFFRSLC